MQEHIPNSITTEDDLNGIKTTKVQFYPEDIEKFEKMSDEDAIKYKAKLIDDGKYTINWNE